MKRQTKHRCWVAVACAEHVRRGKAGGFMQVCHGKAAPLRRVQPDDLVAYYSPTEEMKKGPPLQSFTAIGRVLPGDIRQVDMGGGFHPFRRDVAFAPAQTAAIRPLLSRPGFFFSGVGWGAKLRYGLVEIDPASMAVIAEAMQVDAMLADNLFSGAQETHGLEDLLHHRL